MPPRHPAPIDNASLGDYLFALPQYLLPQHFLSAVMARLTRSRFEPWKNALITGFVRHYGVDMSLAQQQDPKAYPDFNSFFTRSLRVEARPVANAARDIVCPVDGAVIGSGVIEEDTLFQAKGRGFPLSRLLGGSEAHARRFRRGAFASLYLSPRDYHRIHMPSAGTLQETIYIPGRLFSVNPSTTRVIPALFARNERVVALFNTPIGPMAMVLVGAIFVGSIETVWAGLITPPRGRRIRSWNYPPNHTHLGRGQEMGRFNMGSTVILLFGENAVSWDKALQPNAKVRMGQRIGVALESAYTD